MPVRSLFDIWQYPALQRVLQASCTEDMVQMRTYSPCSQKDTP